MSVYLGGGGVQFLVRMRSKPWTLLGGVGGGQGAFDFRKFVMLGNFKTFSPAATPM